MPDPLKLAVIGLGHLHPRTYMPHFQASAAIEVVAVCDSDESLREAFAADFQVPAHADWSALLREEDIDLAYIFLPHDECPAAAEACAERNIHVVVEKPVANTLQGCRRVGDIVRKRAGAAILAQPDSTLRACGN